MKAVVHAILSHILTFCWCDFCNVVLKCYCLVLSDVLKLKSCEISFANKLFISYSIVLCAKFQNNWTIETDVVEERDFVGFEVKMSLGQKSYIAQHPRLYSSSIPGHAKVVYNDTEQWVCAQGCWEHGKEPLLMAWSQYCFIRDKARHDLYSLHLG